MRRHQDYDPLIEVVEFGVDIGLKAHGIDSIAAAGQRGLPELASATSQAAADETVSYQARKGESQQREAAELQALRAQLTKGPQAGPSSDQQSTKD